MQIITGIIYTGNLIGYEAKQNSHNPELLSNIYGLKQLQDVCLKLSLSDKLVAPIHKAMVRPAASISLRGCQFGPCQKMNRTENEEFARDGTDLKLMMKRCSGHRK